jgi:hypothetical protein
MTREEFRQVVQELHACAIGYPDVEAKLKKWFSTYVTEFGNRREYGPEHMIRHNGDVDRFTEQRKFNATQMHLESISSIEGAGLSVVESFQVEGTNRIADCVRFYILGKGKT